MKIHIIRQGDTLFKLAESYQVALADIIASNPQLADPDTVMPGMKITIPTSDKQVNIVDTTTEEQTEKKLKQTRRPMGEVDDREGNKPFRHTPLYPIDSVEERVTDKAEKRLMATEICESEEIAYTREEGGARDLPVHERPLMSPPQHGKEFSFCSQCHQPIYNHKHH